MSVTLSAKTIGRGAFWSIINQSAAQILVLLVFLVTARFVSKEAFGIMAVCLLVVEGFRQVAIEGVAASVISRKDADDKLFNATFVIIVSSGIACAAVVFLLAEPVSVWLNNPDIAPALRWTSLLLVTVGLSKTHEAWLAKQLMFKTLAIRSLISITIGGSIGIWMAVNDYGVISLIAQQLITSLVGAASLWVTTRWRPSLRVEGTQIKSVLNHSRHVSLSAFASFASMQSDVFFASYYLGANQTGVFSAAKRISMAMWLMISSSLNAVALPIQAALRDDKARSAEAYLKCVFISAAFTAPIYIGVAALSPEIVQLLLGPKWADVAPVLSLMALSFSVTALSQYNSNIFLVSNKAHWQTGITVVNGIANFVLFFYMARYGLLALTGAFLVKTILFAPLSILPALRLLQIRWTAFVMAILAPVVSSLIMGALLYLATSQLPTWPSNLRLVVMIVVGAAVYIGLMLVLNRAGVLDIFGLLRQMLRKEKAQ